MSKQPWTSLRGLFFKNSVKSGWQARKDTMLPPHVSLTGTRGNTPKWGSWGFLRDHRWQIQPPTHSQVRPSHHFLIFPDKENLQMFTLHSKGIVRLKKREELLWGKLTHISGLILKLHHTNTVTAAFLPMLFPLQNPTMLRPPQDKPGAVIQIGGQTLAFFPCNLSLPS